MKLSLKSILPPPDLGWNRVRAICALPNCHNKLLMRYVPGSRRGIFVGDQWYCSPDCFSNASRHTLFSLSSPGVVEPPRNPRLSLGLALLSKGYLTADQLRIAVARCEREGIDLQATLTEWGWTSEKQLAAARALQWGYPVLGQDLAGLTVTADLPPVLFHACSATPLYYSAEVKRLVLGFVQRVDHGLLQSIEQITGCRAEPCFITPAEFSRQMERLTAAPGYRQVIVAPPCVVPQMARTLGGIAVEIVATEAAFSRCHGYVWARLAGKRETVDVIFDLKNVEATPTNESSPERGEVIVGVDDGFLLRQSNAGR